MGPRVFALALIALIATACGPLAYVNEVTRRASTSVDAARAAQADKYAPYYWTRATQYLHQARVKAAKSDWEGANRFGRLATEAADLALSNAEIAAKDPSKRPLELKPAVAPAKGDRVAPAKDEP
jgi:hypothetical protein